MSPAPSSLNNTDVPGLASRAFVGLAATHFLTVLLDNAFRWLVVAIGQSVVSGEASDSLSLALGGACATAPFLVFVAAAGSLADRYSKRQVIVACKVAELAIVGLGGAALMTLNPWLLFGVVTLLASRSALFGPSRFGMLAEILPASQLSQGNGILGMTTVTAASIGTAAGFRAYAVLEGRGFLAAPSVGAAGPVLAVLGVLALVGAAASLFITRQPAANPAAPLRINPITDTWPALRVIGSDKRLLRCALGIGFFWFLAVLSQLNIDPFGDMTLGLAKEDIGLLLAVLVVGMAAGSVLAGWWSEGKVELGIVPLGALGIIASSLVLFVAGNQVDPAARLFGQAAFWWSAVGLFSLGVSAGLFDIPLEAYLQHRSDDRVRGTVLAGSNFIAFSMMLLACGVFFALRGGLGMSPTAIFVVAGLGTIPVAIYVFRLLPNVTVRFLFWLAAHSIYRLRVRGRENIPESGGVLLVANHVSWMDGILVLISSSRMVRFLVYADYANNPWLAWLSRIMRVIPIKASDGPKSIVRALQAAREAVTNGEVVCIFAEGQLTRTGQINTFQPGLMRVVGGSGAPVIPVYLHGLWGSIFSYKHGRFFWKWPRRWPYPVAIHFGKPMTEPGDVSQVRQAVELLGAEAVQTDSRRPIPARQFVRECRRSMRRPKLADSSGVDLAGGKVLAGSVAMLRALRRDVLAADEKNVGLLLPPSVGGCLANMALALGRRVAVNLNYTMSDEVINHCVREAGLRHVLTSRRFIEKKPVALEGAEFVYLEDVKERISGMDKACGALAAYVLPAAITERLLRLTAIPADELLTIIFTSGSTGEPKGVMLSQSNIRSNIDAVDQLLSLRSNDVLLGVLPFFHSFGYTACMWLPMCYSPKAVYHFNPLDARMVGSLSEKHRVTILMATPTFLRTYLRRIEPQQFESLDLAVVGAEKLPTDLAEQFQARFKVLPSEGYGTTELSPVVSINVPAHRAHDPSQLTSKLGTIGRPIPGVAAKIVEPESRADLGVDKEGLLLIKGPNVMQGYLHQPEKTAEMMTDGWYNTGDYAAIDRDGFIRITGRQSRFSKIGGEMVPHLRIEEEIAKIIDAEEQPDLDQSGADIRVAVTCVPDESKGERIIVIHRPLRTPIDEIRRRLSDAGLPNIWIPGKDSFVEVEQIPLLGTGKLDLKGLQMLALEKTGGEGTA